MKCIKWLFRWFSKPKLKYEKEYHFNDDFSKDAKDSPLNSIQSVSPVGTNGRVYPDDTFHQSVLDFNKRRRMKVPVGDGKKKPIPKIFMPFKDEDNEN